MEDLEFNKCYYRPSFFQMKIDVPVDLRELRGIPDGALSLYLHEYIHFIQDISTIYGLMNMSIINYYIQDCAYRIYNEGNKAFEVPIYIKSREGDYGSFNINLKPIYMGSKINPKYNKIDVVSYSWGKEKIDEDLNIDKIDVIIKELEGNKEIKISLGGNLITEGMAYLAESYVCLEISENIGYIIPADEYPYSVVEKIAQLIYPELAQNHLLLISICDCSLMTYHPGLSFIRALEYLKENKFLEKNIEEVDVINTLYNEVSVLLKGNHVDFDEIIENVRDSIKQSFKGDIFEGNNKWLDIIFDRIKIFRNNRPQFITDFLQYGNLKNNELFWIFHNCLGSPLVFNSEYEGTFSIPYDFVPNNFRPDLFGVIHQILRIFTNNKPTPCELKEYCIKSKEVSDPNLVIDERCDNSPWTRYGDKDLCPMGAIWKNWALSEFYPIIK